MPPHPLKNFQIEKYCQYKPEFNGFYWGNNLPKINDGAYVIYLNEFKSLGAHCIPYMQRNSLHVLYVKAKNVAHFDSSGFERIPK